MANAKKTLNILFKTVLRIFLDFNQINQQIEKYEWRKIYTNFALYQCLRASYINLYCRWEIMNWLNPCELIYLIDTLRYKLTHTTSGNSDSQRIAQLRLQRTKWYIAKCHLSHEFVCLALFFLFQVAQRENEFDYKICDSFFFTHCYDTFNSTHFSSRNHAPSIKMIFYLMFEQSTIILTWEMKFDCKIKQPKRYDWLVWCVNLSIKNACIQNMFCWHYENNTELSQYKYILNLQTNKRSISNTNVIFKWVACVWVSRVQLESISFGWKWVACVWVTRVQIDSTSFGCKWVAHVWMRRIRLDKISFGC